MFGRKAKREQIITETMQLLKDDNYRDISDYLVRLLDDIHGDNIIPEGKKQKGRQFEMFLEELFKASGYHVELTEYCGDGGIDLYIDRGGEKYAIQAKKRALNTTDLIGVKDIREFAGALVEPGYQKVLITTHFYSKNAWEEADKFHIQLIDKEGLVRLIGQMQSQLLAKGYMKKLMGNFGFCKECGSPMVKGFKAGPYYHCVRYKNGCDAKTIKASEYEKDW